MIERLPALKFCFYFFGESSGWLHMLTTSPVQMQCLKTPISVSWVEGSALAQLPVPEPLAASNQMSHDGKTIYSWRAGRTQEQTVLYLQSLSRGLMHGAAAGRLCPSAGNAGQVLLMRSVKMKGEGT